MATMNISLPNDLKTFVDGHVLERGYSTSSEYVRDLIRRDRDRERLRSLLLEGASSPLEGEADAAWFESLREKVRARSR